VIFIKVQIFKLRSNL